MKVSKFKSLKEERELWDTHDSTDYHDPRDGTLLIKLNNHDLGVAILCCVRTYIP
jgi:hypothetical protein